MIIWLTSIDRTRIFAIVLIVTQGLFCFRDRRQSILSQNSRVFPSISMKRCRNFMHPGEYNLRITKHDYPWLNANRQRVRSKYSSGERSTRNFTYTPSQKFRRKNRSNASEIGITRYVSSWKQRERERFEDWRSFGSGSDLAQRHPINCSDSYYNDIL